jgi:hypothetical protein
MHAPHGGIYGACVCKQSAPPIPSVSDPAGNPGAAGDQGGPEGVLQKNCKVEPAAPQIRYQAGKSREASMHPISVVLKNFVYEFGRGIDVPDPGAHEKGNMRAGEKPADLFHRRDGDHSVADPVGAAYQNLPG